MKTVIRKHSQAIIALCIMLTMLLTMLPTFAAQPSAAAASAPPESTIILPRSGEDKLIVVLVEFSDRKLSSTGYGNKSPEQYWSDMVFGGSGTGRSVNSFYAENSNGKFQFAAERLPNSNEPVAGIYRVSLPDTFANRGDLAIKALSALQNRYNFKFAEAYSDTFLKSKNVIQGSAFCPPGGLHLLFVAAGYGAGGGKGRTEDNSGAALGVPNTMYNHIVIEEQQSGGKINIVGVPAHELGHDIGLPDLYTYGESSSDEPEPEYYTSLDIGIYGSDSYGNAPTHFDPWSKQKLGWYTPTTTIPDKLNPAGDSVNYNILKVPSPDPYQYFLIENRQQQGFDSGLRGVTNGIVFWRIDDWVNGSKDDYAVNSHARHGVTIIPRGGVKNGSQGGHALNEEVFLTYHTGATTPETSIGWGGQVWMRDAAKTAMPRAYKVVNGIGGGLTVKEMGEFSAATNVTVNGATLNFTTCATGKDKGFQYKIYASTNQYDVADSESMKSLTPIATVIGTNSYSYSYSLSYSAVPNYSFGKEVYYNIIVDAKNAASGIFPSGTTGGTAAYRAANISGEPNPYAAKPVITAQPINKIVNVGDAATLSVTASVTDGGTLSYQWYSAASSTNSGGTAIPNATASTFSVPTAAAGTKYYYCVVTNTNSAATVEKTAATPSAAASVSVYLPMENYALGKPAKAYNAAGTFLGTSDALTNGIPNDIWTPNNGTYPTTFVVELGEYRSIDLLEIEWEKVGLPFQFKIYANIQGQGETLLMDKSAQSGVLDKKEVIELGGKLVQSVKIEITGKSGSGNITNAWPNVSEVRALGTDSANKAEITVTAGNGGTVLGGGTYPLDSQVTLTAIPKPDYEFEGWYKNGIKIADAEATYVFTVKKSAEYEARFKNIPPLEITGINIVGKSNLTFTASVTGGVKPLKYAFYILADGKVYYTDSNSDSNFFSYTPMEKKSYTVVAYCIDSRGSKASYSKTFSVN